MCLRSLSGNKLASKVKLPLQITVWVWETAQQDSAVSCFGKRHWSSRLWNKCTKETSVIIQLEMLSVLFIFMLWAFSSKKRAVCWIVVTQQKQINLLVRTEISQVSQACLQRLSVTMIDVFKMNVPCAFSLDIHIANMPLCHLKGTLKRADDLGIFYLGVFTLTVRLCTLWSVSD